MKWDGMRALVGIERGTVWATSRAGNDATARFPELAGLGAALGDVDALLDGELVALDESGIPRFERLQPRMQAGSAAAVPPACRRAAGRLHDVRRALARRPLDVRAPVHRPARAARTPRARGRRLADATRRRWAAGPAVLAASQRLGLEGVVAKRLDSHYLPGKRADAWRKVKPTQGQELVVGGWLPGAGRLEGSSARCSSGTTSAPAIRAVAVRGTGRLRDRCGQARRARSRGLGPLRRATSPFDATPRLPDPVWVEPEVVVEVAFHEWTSAGVLRAPRDRGLRDDKRAADVVRET